MTEKRGPGRPRKPGGPDPTRSMRLGDVYDQAMLRAAQRGEKITHVVARKLAEYLEETGGIGSPV